MSIVPWNRFRTDYKQAWNEIYSNYVTFIDSQDPLTESQKDLKEWLESENFVFCYKYNVRKDFIVKLLQRAVLDPNQKDRIVIAFRAYHLFESQKFKLDKDKDFKLHFDTLYCNFRVFCSNKHESEFLEILKEFPWAIFGKAASADFWELKQIEKEEMLDGDWDLCFLIQQVVKANWHLKQQWIILTKLWTAQKMKEKELDHLYIFCKIRND